MQTSFKSIDEIILEISKTEKELLILKKVLTTTKPDTFESRILLWLADEDVRRKESHLQMINDLVIAISDPTIN